MHHFSFISQSYVLQNKLQKDVYEYLKSKDRQVIESKNVKEFQENILNGILALELLNPKCKSINAHWSESGSKYGLADDYVLYFGAGNICVFQIYAATN